MSEHNMPFKCEASGLPLDDPAPQQTSCPKCGHVVNVDQTAEGFLIRPHQKFVKGMR